MLTLSSTAVAADYLSVDLRAAVDQLKLEVAASPTTTDTFQARAEVLWRWVNAFSLTGGYVPVNLTAVLRVETPGAVPANYVAMLDDFIRELSLAEDDPAALGTLTAATGPFEARSFATITQTWTVGSRPVTRGGGLLVAKHFMADHGPYQTSDPQGANYLKITSSARRARFVADSRPLFGMHGGFRGAQPALFFRLSSGSLEPGDTVTITYGARGDGGPGMTMPSFSSDRMPFPLYLAFNADSQLYSLPIQPIVVSGTALHGVAGFAPSVLRPGEAFTLSIRARDRYYNRAQGPYPGWRVVANGQELARVDKVTDAIVTVDELSFKNPGVYRLAIESLDGSITGTTNPILVSAEASRIFWGDTHGHSGFAEGIGTPDRFMTWARDDARLDFVTHSEHDVWLDDHEWSVLQDNVQRFSEEGRFLAYLGYEWTTGFRYGGHHNVLFRTPGNRQRIATQFYPVLSDLWAGLRAHHDPDDVVVIPHAHNPGHARSNDPQLSPLVEIMSQHGTFEWFGRLYLQKGHQIGFTAASDNHLSQPGYTAPKGSNLSQRGGLGAVMAPALTRDDVFDALKSLSAYATTGDRIILQTTLNGTPMGQRTAMTESRILEGRVIGTAPIERITVMKNDAVLWEEDYLTIDDGRFAEEETFYLSFESLSVPLHPGDAPRGWRPWYGTLRVENADLVDVAPTDFNIANQTQLIIDPENPNQLSFRTATRGDSSSLRLRLRNAKPRTRIELTLTEAKEFGGAPPALRAHATLPAASTTLRLGDLDAGRVSTTLPFQIYNDRVTLRRSISDGPADVEFRVEDSGSVHGDYYYVRVKQVDDALAWSSPIWVGGFPPR